MDYGIGNMSPEPDGLAGNVDWFICLEMNLLLGEEDYLLNDIA